MRIIKKRSSSRGSALLEAAITVPVIMLLVASMMASMTAVNVELFVQRATENVVQEINVAIPFLSQGFGCIEDVTEAFGVGDLLDVDLDAVDSVMGVVGGISGATGVDLSDVLGTMAFGRFVRDRILLEYRKLSENSHIFSGILTNVSVYLDYDGQNKSVFVKVYYALSAVQYSWPREYCSSIALYADSIPKKETEKEPGDDDDSVWEKDNFTRGTLLREKYGGNLPFNFPVISRFKDNEAMSIKSIDTTSPYYQNLSRLNSLVKEYIDDLAEFNGAKWGSTTVEGKDIRSRKLLIILPRNGADSCKHEIQALTAYAKSKGVVLVLEEYGDSYRYVPKEGEEENK